MMVNTTNPSNPSNPINLDALESAVAATEDATGLHCPMPILRTKKALAKLEAGQLLKVLTTDKAARMDLTVFCQQTGHVLHAQTSQADSDISVHYIQKRQP